MKASCVALLLLMLVGLASLDTVAGGRHARRRRARVTERVAGSRRPRRLTWNQPPVITDFQPLSDPPSSNDQLMAAINNRACEAVAAALKAGADSNYYLKKVSNNTVRGKVVIGNYNATALGYATKSGSACVVKALVDASADIEAKTFGQGVTPLMMLFVSGQHGFLKLGSQDARKIFNYFMEAKANVNAMDKWHATSLIHASHQNNGSEYVQGMIAAGANVNAIADVEGGSHGGGLHPRTALAWAAGNNQLETAKLLLQNGATMPQTDDEREKGLTPLIFAVIEGHQTMAQLLLNASANIEAQAGEYGNSPLMYAAENGRLLMTEFLIGKGAAIDGSDYDGLTALHAAVTEGHGGVVDFLISKNANVNTQESYDGTTPAITAAEYDEADIMKSLIKAGADLSVKDNNGFTALTKAENAEPKSSDVLQVLAETEKLSCWVLSGPVDPACYDNLFKNGEMEEVRSAMADAETALASSREEAGTAHAEAAAAKEEAAAARQEVEDVHGVGRPLLLFFGGLAVGLGIMAAVMVWRNGSCGPGASAPTATWRSNPIFTREKKENEMGSSNLTKHDSLKTMNDTIKSAV